ACVPVFPADANHRRGNEPDLRTFASPAEVRVGVSRDSRHAADTDNPSVPAAFVPVVAACCSAAIPAFHSPPATVGSVSLPGPTSAAPPATNHTGQTDQTVCLSVFPDRSVFGNALACGVLQSTVVDRCLPESNRK